MYVLRSSSIDSHWNDLLTASRFLLRRAAARTLSQSTRTFSTLRPVNTRVTVFQPVKPALYRPFHQTRIWRAEEVKDTQPGEAEEEPAVAAAASEDAAEMAQPNAEEAQEAAETVPPMAASAESNQASNTSNSVFPNDRASSSTGTDFRNPQQSCILYVGNLFFEVTPAQLESEFAQFGRITNSRVVTDARGLSKGFGYIEFESQQGADTAVKQLDQKVFQGRRMAVQYHVKRESRRGMQNKEPNPPSKTLFIGNMSYQMSDRDLNGMLPSPNSCGFSTDLLC